MSKTRKGAVGTIALKQDSLFGGTPVAVPADAWVGVYVDDGKASLVEGWGAATVVLEKSDITGSINGLRRSFWLSFDRCNRRVKYGVGHYREETTLLQAAFSPEGMCYFSLIGFGAAM
jgi:hypothetical protein